MVTIYTIEHHYVMITITVMSLLPSFISHYYLYAIMTLLSLIKVLLNPIITLTFIIDVMSLLLIYAIRRHYYYYNYMSLLLIIVYVIITLSSICHYHNY